jgi:hypothetical protein
MENQVRELDRMWLYTVKLSLDRMVQDHMVCYEDNSEDCMFHVLDEIADMMQEILERTEQ